MESDISKLKEEANQIQEFLQITCSNNPIEIQERICDMMVYMSRSGEMLEQAKKILRRRKSLDIHETIIAVAKAAHLSASVQNALLDSICEEESFLVDYLDRINRSCTHQLDALRSLLSYNKEELRLNN